MKRQLALFVVLVSGFLTVSPAVAQSIVKVVNHDGEFQLVRNDEPYTVHGVGGTSHLALLAAVGGNSIRTWDTENIGSILNEAHRHKLTVCVGFWLGHARHGFNYHDTAAVEQQRLACIETVRRFKHHPALLMWSIGNEMEGDGTDKAVWRAVEQIAAECKRTDPHHPTMTVIGELGANASKVVSIEQLCPSIDIIGVNSYGGVGSLAERYRAAGISRPYIVTEFGVHGPWEVAKTKWGAPFEPTSTAKAKSYATAYRQAVVEQRGLCLGAYAFLWGHKQETTATWFGMLLPDGSRLAAVDAMTAAWTGQPPRNHCPKIETMTLSKTSQLQPGEILHASIAVAGVEMDQLRYQWVLRHDSGTIGTGGDFQVEEAVIENSVSSEKTRCAVTVPDGGGAYRLYAYVYDNDGGAAVANTPIFVDGPIRPVPAPKARLPYTVYADEVKSVVYAPSGYMGNTNAIKMTLDCTDRPHSGKTCLRVDYLAADNWGGVLWQSPANDWDGAKPGGLNLTGAIELEFWARGDKGGETVSFSVGGLDRNHEYHDTAKCELQDIRLTAKWQKLRIPLDLRDLSRIKTGFGWSLAGQGKPVTFYLDDIRYVPKSQDAPK